MSKWSEWSKGGVKVPHELRADILEQVGTRDLPCTCTYILVGNTIVLRIRNHDGTELHVEAKIRRQRTRV